MFSWVASPLKPTRCLSVLTRFRAHLYRHGWRQDLRPRQIRGRIKLTNPAFQLFVFVLWGVTARKDRVFRCRKPGPSTGVFQYAERSTEMPGYEVSAHTDLHQMYTLGRVVRRHLGQHEQQSGCVT